MRNYIISEHVDLCQQSLNKQWAFEQQRFNSDVKCPLCDGHHGRNYLCQMSYDIEGVAIQGGVQ